MWSDHQALFARPSCAAFVRVIDDETRRKDGNALGESMAMSRQRWWSVRQRMEKVYSRPWRLIHSHRFTLTFGPLPNLTYTSDQPHRAGCFSILTYDCKIRTFSYRRSVSRLRKLHDTTVFKLNFAPIYRLRHLEQESLSLGRKKAPSIPASPHTSGSCARPR
jgi:hypothetical protein